MSKNVAVCFETDISGFRQAFFYVLKRLAFGTALEEFDERQYLISGEGVSPSLSPRRLRAKYTLRTNLRFMLRGFRPAGGKFAQAQIYPLPPKGGRIDGAAAYGYILVQTCSSTGGTFAKSLYDCQTDSRELPGYGHQAHRQPSDNGYSQKSCGDRLFAKGREKHL